MRVTYCDKCGDKIEAGSNYGGRIGRKSNISFPTELNDGKLVTEIIIEIDVVPKQYDICTGCRLESLEKLTQELKEEYKNQ